MCLTTYVHTTTAHLHVVEPLVIAKRMIAECMAQKNQNNLSITLSNETTMSSTWSQQGSVCKRVLQIGGKDTLSPAIWPGLVNVIRALFDCISNLHLARVS